MFFKCIISFNHHNNLKRYDDYYFCLTDEEKKVQESYLLSHIASSSCISQLRLPSENTIAWVALESIGSYFLTVRWAKGPRSRFQLMWFLVRPLFLAYRQLPYPNMALLQDIGHGETRELSRVSFDTNPIRSGSHYYDLI